MSRSVNNWIESRPIWVIELDSYRLAGTKAGGVYYGDTRKQMADYIRVHGIKGAKPIKVFAKYERA